MEKGRVAVSRILSDAETSGRPFLSPACADAPLARGATNTRNVFRSRGTAGAGRHSCSVLHRTGFVLPPRLLSGRWALTPPFQPYPPKRAVYFLRHFPWRRTCVRRPRACARRAAPRCPDFPLRSCTTQRPPATRRVQTTPRPSRPQSPLGRRLPPGVSSEIVIEHRDRRLRRPLPQWPPGPAVGIDFPRAAQIAPEHFPHGRPGAGVGEQ